MAFNPRAQERLALDTVNPRDFLIDGLGSPAPWDSIVDFVTSESFCGLPIFPRQVTLLRLIFLETEQMSDYDIDVIEDWRKGFTRHRDIYGVQPDIWQRIEYLKARGYRRFPHIQNVLGRRASKGVIGGILACEQIAYIHSLDDPQNAYGILEGKDIYFNVGATSQTTAKRQLFADIRDMVERCKYFRPPNRPSWIAESKADILRVRTPADLRRIAELKIAKIPIDHQIASLVAVALSASSVAGRGSTSALNAFDEFAFHVQTGSSKSDTEIYKDWAPNLGQVGKDALTYVPSSPATKAGYFYMLYEMGRVLMSTYKDESGMREEARQQLVNAGHVVEEEADPSWLIFQNSSWSLYEDWSRTSEILGLGYSFSKPPEPDLKDERQIRERRRDPNKFKVEKLGQFSEVMGAYLDPDAVDRMFEDPEWRPPLEPQSYGTFNRKYRIHCDPGRTGANFALAIAHLEDAPPDEHGKIWPCVIFDLLHVWRPMDFPEDVETHKQTIDYVRVHQDLEHLLGNFKSTDRISFDQWNSSSFIASLRQKFSPGIRVSEVTFSEKSNQERCEKFKSALNLGWVKAYRDSLYVDNTSCLLELECKFLAEKNGKVIKQDVGPVVTKDLFDCAQVVTVDLLHDALDRWSSGTLTAGAYGSTDAAGLKSGREFERMSGALAPAATVSLRQSSQKASDVLESQRRGKGLARRSGGYSPDRLNSIRTRQPRLPR